MNKYLIATAFAGLTSLLPAKAISPIDSLGSKPLDSLYMTVNIEFDKDSLADFDKIADAMNFMNEGTIASILRNRQILAGEHSYNAEVLWNLHTSALRLGTHSKLARWIRRTNKFQSTPEAKDRVKNDILKYLKNNKYQLPNWIDFNDLNVIEERKVGYSNPVIDHYFRDARTNYNDDTPWCAAYVASKLKNSDEQFNLPPSPLRAASFGGFTSSSFSFNKVSKSNRSAGGRYEYLTDLDYLPHSGAYDFTFEDFQDKNKVPFGSLVVFRRQGGGHVGFAVGVMRDSFTITENDVTRTVKREGVVVLGGNQNDAVQFMVFYDMNMIKAVSMPTKFRREDYAPLPELKNMFDMPEFYDRYKHD